MEDSVKSFSAEKSLQLITFFMAKEIKTFVMLHRFVSTLKCMSLNISLL